MRRLLPALLISAALACVALQAQAAVVIYTFAGTVSDGFDATGVFGAANRNLAGRAFTASFTRDDSVLGAIQTYAATESRIEGLGVRSPLTLAHLTIDGHTHAFGSRSGRQFQSSESCGAGCATDAFGFSADDRFSGLMPSSSLVRSMSKELNLGGAGTSILSDPDYHSLKSLGPGGLVDFSGGFSIFDEISTFFIRPTVISSQQAYGFFEIDSLSVTGFGAAAVPEPSTWALSIAGFAGAGLMLRRRRPLAA